MECNFRRNDGRTWSAEHCPEINDDASGQLEEVNVDIDEYICW